MSGDRLAYVPWYADDWAGGTKGFTLEQRGFYFECLMRMWARKGGLPNDIKWLAGALQCDPRTVRRILPFLITEKKLRVEDGLLVNDRMMREIARAEVGGRSGEDRPKIGRRSGEDRPEKIQKPNEINGGEKHPYPYPSQKEEKEEKTSEDGGGLGGEPPLSATTLAALIEIDPSPSWARRVGTWARELVAETSPAAVEAAVETSRDAIRAGRIKARDPLAYIASIARNRHHGRPPTRDTPTVGEVLIKLTPAQPSPALRASLRRTSPWGRA